MAEPRRALSVHTSISDPDSVLSPIRINSPTVNTSTPPERLSRHQQIETLISPVSHHWSRQAGQDTQPPLEEVCQLKKRIAELELLNGRMVSRLDELERRPSSPPSASPPLVPHQEDLCNDGPEELDCSATESDNEISINTTSFIDHHLPSDNQLDEEYDDDEDEEEDMIDETC
jgi:hypothetical protein